jgi:hypothetical protein
VRLFKSKEDKQQIDAGRAEFDAFAREARHRSPEAVKPLALAFKENARVHALSERERRRRGNDAFRAFAENALADDYLTIDEEMAFEEVASALGIEQQDFDTRFIDLLYRLVVAKANDGRLDIVETPSLMTKKNEVVHLEVGAALMKEVVQREFRAGSKGFSFRVAKGVYYRTGNTRGRSVVVGTEIVAEDTGTLAVTSQRIAYLGQKKTVEVPFAKLMNVEVFTDGSRLHASNRQKAPLLQLADGLGNVVAATLNTAVQRYNE